MSETSTVAIESTLQETRVFPPPSEFAEAAHIKSFEEYEQIYNQATEDLSLIHISEPTRPY